MLIEGIQKKISVSKKCYVSGQLSSSRRLHGRAQGVQRVHWAGRTPGVQRVHGAGWARRIHWAGQVQDRGPGGRGGRGDRQQVRGQQAGQDHCPSVSQLTGQAYSILNTNMHATLTKDTNATLEFFPPLFLRKDDFKCMMKSAFNGCHYKSYVAEYNQSLNLYQNVEEIIVKHCLC